MTILLTTPFDPGDNDQGGSYPRVKLVSAEILFTNKTIIFHLEYGDVVSGSWVKGVGAPTRPLVVKPSQFDSVMSGENLSNKVYTYLLNQSVVSGSIE